MLNKPRLNLILLVYLAFSVFGLLTIIILALYPPTAPMNFPFQKPIIGAIFVLICTVGGLAAVVPGGCSKMFGSHKQSRFVAFHTMLLGNRVMEGHHPSCGRFSAHVVKINRHVLCAACTGLFLGAIVAIFGTVAYFFVGLDIERFGLLATVVGMGFIALGFAQFGLKSFTRLLLNMIFVVGAFLILLGVNALVKNLFIDFYLISLVILWILTRILLSEWDHLRICRYCKLKCIIKE